MIGFLKRIFGTANDRAVRKLRQEVEKINALEQNYTGLSDEDLRQKTTELKSRLQNGITLDEITYEAFAIVREAAKKVLGQRHYDEQMIGGLALHRGMISEMRTGEGKTLVATLPGYLNALSGLGVHIVTVNDYLAKRDSEWVGRIFRFLGLTVGCVTSNMPIQDRKEAYLADITYATNNELGFDYLRDNMRYSLEERAQRALNYCIIDEVDSILIDESRTPLIISGPVEQNTDLYIYANKIVNTLDESDSEKDEKNKSVSLTDAAITKVEDLLAKYRMIEEGTTLFDFENIRLLHYINQALRAQTLFRKDVDYIVKDGKLLIIDEFTGRIMEGRRYSDGLHQALEAKEGLVVQNENQTLASITFQNYFRMYKKLAGMTGTAMTEAGELKDIYNLDVLAIPTHNKVQRKDHDDEIYGTKQEKYDAILKDVKARHEKGQPILIGTISIEKSEEISNILKKAGIKHNVLNAKQHEKEAYIIAQAGRLNAVTIATNMAGRGTDIMLGGNPEMLAEESNIDPTIDLKKFDKIKKLVVEEKAKVIEAGGLYVLGTERHESRRIDNQLRGRSGRQGDPGETKFFLSLDDDLMRIFASEKMSSLLRTLGLKNGEAIFHPMINRAIEKAQQKVEAHHYEIRKNLLRFDNVMNEQRRIIYEQRDSIITSKNISDSFSNILEEISHNTVRQFIPKDSFRDQWNIEGLAKRVKSIFGINLDQQEILESDITEEDIVNKIISDSKTIYEKKLKHYSPHIMNEASRYMMLHILDHLWKDHLHTLDQLKHGIHLRAYGQKDPLNEYKKEALMFFEMMIEKLQELFIQTVLKFEVDKENFEKGLLSLNRLAKQSELSETREDPAFAKYNPGSTIDTKLSPVKSFVAPENRDPKDPSTWGKIKRNDMCPCGSEKKYKQCHGSLI